MKPTPISIRDKVKELFSKENNYYLLIHIANKDVCNREIENNGFLGVMFPIGKYPSFESAKSAQEAVAIRTGAAVSIIKGGDYMPLYITNPSSITTQFKFDPTAPFSEIKNEIEKQRKRNEEIKKKNPGLTSLDQVEKSIEEIQNKIDKLEKKSMISHEEKSILRLHYSQAISEMKTSLKNVDIYNELLERTDDSTLSFVINEIYKFASSCQIIRDTEKEKLESSEKITKHFKEYPEHLETWRDEANSILSKRGEEDLLVLIDEFYTNSK